MTWRGRKQLWAMSLREEGEPAISSGVRRRTEFTKVVALWIPRRFLLPSGIDVHSFVSDVNEKIVQRGFILWDGQVLTTPLADIPTQGVLHPEAVTFNGQTWHRPIRFGQHSEVICELNGGDAAYDVPPKRDWLAPQREFFGLTNPYQMAEDGVEYTWSHLMSRVVEPYLSPDERIAAIVYGEKDNYYFYCPCHSADVVYTTRQRLVCMGCGATHLVLRDQLPFTAKRLLTAEEWTMFFDEDGELRDEEVEISIVDFQEVENADTVWKTNQWEEAKHRFVFFARSSPEEIAEATRGTEADPTIFVEAGWTPIETTPPPAHQVADDSVDVDLVENAAHALREGVGYFIGARKNSERLVSAIPQLFRAVELLLKARLQALDPRTLDAKPNNPTVLKQLVAAGVALSKDEVEIVTRLRRLRNDLQHGAAKFNHRRGLAVSRAAIVFIDRFTHVELGLWVGDVVPPDGWHELLAIAQIAGTAEQVVEGRMAEIQGQPDAEISSCERCGRDTMVRPHPRTGASCLFCGHIPISREPNSLM